MEGARLWWAGAGRCEGKKFRDQEADDLLVFFGLLFIVVSMKLDVLVQRSVGDFDDVPRSPGRDPSGRLGEVFEGGMKISTQWRIYKVNLCSHHPQCLWK